MTTSRLYGLAFLPVGLASIYVLFLALVLHPTFQAHNVFLHSINIPFHHDLTRPDKLRAIGKGRARNVNIYTTDNVRIAAWHILPDNLPPYDGADGAAPANDKKAQAYFDQALLRAPVVLYFHGNAMNRAAPVRINAYNHLSALGVNVVAIDYRGFGDSEGTPSEQGLILDARAVFKWVMERQAGNRAHAASDGVPLAGEILLSGQSLGTGVASRLTLDLIDAGQAPKATLLLAPYTSIRQLLTSYRIGGILPLFWPLGLSNALQGVVDSHLYTRFESDKALYIAARGGRDMLDEQEYQSYKLVNHQLSKNELRKQLGLSNFEEEEGDKQQQQNIVPQTSSSVSSSTHMIIAHADDDAIIPHTQGRTLFDCVHGALAKEFLSNLAAAPAAKAKAKAKEEILAQQIHIQDYAWGSLLTVAPRPGQPMRLSLVKSRKGGHNGVPPHAIQYFIDVATGTHPATAVGDYETEIDH